MSATIWSRSLRPIAVAAVLLVPGLKPALADAPHVFVTIKPIHSLVASVMRGVGSPYLLLKGGASPHAYAMRPSEARRLANAKVVFWVGEDLEAFLEKPLKSLAGKATVVALHEVKGVHLLKTRSGGVWDAHDHDHHAAHDAKKKATDHKHDDHDHDHKAKKKATDHKHDHDHDHADGAYDMHLWLDPHNAEAMVKAIAAALIKADPAHAAAYRKNAEATLERIEALETDLGKQLAPVRKRPFIVFHDAYQYFEKRFGLAAAGSITLNPQRAPGAQRLAAIRKRIRDANVRCVFVEPQFAPRLVEAVITGTKARKATLDPLGAAIPEGPDAYFKMVRGIGTSLRACLG